MLYFNIWYGEHPASPLIVFFFLRTKIIFVKKLDRPHFFRKHIRSCIF